MLIRRHQEVCGNAIEMTQIMVILFIDFLDGNNNSASFKFFKKITGQTN